MPNSEGCGRGSRKGTLRTYGESASQAHTTAQSQGQDRDNGRDSKTCLDITAAAHGDDVPMSMYKPGLVQ